MLQTLITDYLAIEQAVHQAKTNSIKWGAQSENSKAARSQFIHWANQLETLTTQQDAKISAIASHLQTLGSQWETTADGGIQQIRHTTPSSQIIIWNTGRYLTLFIEPVAVAIAPAQPPNTLQTLITTYQDLTQTIRQVSDEFASLHHRTDYLSESARNTEIKLTHQHLESLISQREQTAQDVAVRLREELGCVSTSDAGIEYINHIEPTIGRIRCERINGVWKLWITPTPVAVESFEAIGPRTRCIKPVYFNAA
ncbi:MAG: hypothetical protein F6J87_30170 [Spirulina sp. SIO3F2]|nr:hypothetical protein [Spirulina sp. SIO3F2]